MRNIVPKAQILALLLSAAGAAMHGWLVLVGPDEKGLYPAVSAPGILMWVVSAVALVLFWLLSRQTDAKRSYSQNFPPSAMGALGYLAAVLGIGVVSVRQILGDSLVPGILGLLSCIMLALGGYGRLKGRKTNFTVHLVPCLFFVVELFSYAKIMGAEPELVRYLPGFLACLASLLACYQLWGFDAMINLGNRNKSLFWSMSAGYLCLMAAPGSDLWPAYAGAGLWFLLNLCSLKPLRRKPAAPVEPDPVQELEALLDIPVEVPEQIDPVLPPEEDLL